MDDKHCTHCGSIIRRAVHPNTKQPFCDSDCYGAWQRGKNFTDQSKPVRPRRACAVDRCSSVHFGRGYCRKHYLSLVYSPPKRPTPHTSRHITCAHCGTVVVASHKKARYCSIACSSAASKKPFIVKKGYRKVLIPAHPRADAKGYVFEHIVVAEAVLGRRLAKGEEIHHKDFNRQNNAPNNLKVCANHAEHMRFHRSGGLIS